MPSLKEVQLKIGSIKQTKKITKAMNMVATSRLRGAQQNMEAFRPYAEKFAEVLGSLAEKSGDDASPLLFPKDEVKNIHIVLCTSDRGLCGGFNANLIRVAEKYLEANSDRDVTISFTNFGKKGRDWCRKNTSCEIKNEYLGVVGGKFGFNVAATAGQQLINGFLDDTYDEVHIIYSEFHGMGKQVPVMKQLLPIPAIETKEEVVEQPDEGPYMAEHICEPSPDEILGEMLPKNVYIQIYSALLETSTSEHAARMTAMDNASKACNDMIEELTLLFNKARQAAITAELMDIVGGAEALKG
ncbi:MAG: ATP synthase F1 subunit gamma [Thermodesulfobacteriota bacterium]|nr:ATP synthase F1 subunit gamma [Thermodesulfobacteriota bacterium]